MRLLHSLLLVVVINALYGQNRQEQLQWADSLYNHIDQSENLDFLNAELQTDSVVNIYKR